ncbi:proliferation marker protein Ki-67 [Pyxicephalus adspersus]|uniref:proliferation marker protein Ki-67 n=1 Tax=Pyxicephalus adspersus TaxID=30357 RepID=UPI003B5C6B40
MPCHGKIIVIKRSGVDGTHFPLTAKTCLFGRKTECDIRIQLPHVSKEHCKVDVRENGEVFVTNLSSVNPTQLNGNAVKQPMRIKHGDIITIIDRSFRFENPQSQGRRRSAGLDSENFKLFASNQSDDTNETVRIESITTSKTQRKSEGNVTRTTHTRRSLQTSSEAKKDQSPFGDLYEMFKSKVESSKKENGQTPVKESRSSPKNVPLKRNFQSEMVSQSPATSRRDSRRSQSSDSANVQSKETKVEPRSVSADRVREQSKSPSRGPRNSLTKQKQGSSLNSPVVSNTPALASSAHEEASQNHVQTPRRRSGKQGSGSQEQEASVQKQSPRRSRSAEETQADSIVTSPSSSSQRRSKGQSVPQPAGIENQENSPLPVQSPRSRRSASKETPTKPVETEEKVNQDVQGLGKRKSPKKRRSDEASLNEPPFKRKRVSFGGHLSPELFDKRLPPNSPLKKGATPARRSLSLNSPRVLIRKSFGLKQTMIKEVFELPTSQLVSSPLVTPRRISAFEAAKSYLAEESSPKRRSSTVNKKSPSKSPLPVAITPVKQSPRRSPAKTLSTRSPVISSSKTPVKSELETPAKKSPVSKSPVSDNILPFTPAGKPSVATSTTPAKRSPSTRSPRSPAKLSTPGKRSPGRPPGKQSPAKLSTPGKRSPGRLSTPGKRSPGRPPSATPAKRSPAKLSTPGKRSPGKSPASKSPVKLSTTPGRMSPVVKSPKTPIPYTKGRFSISRVNTPPQLVENVSVSKTPKQPRKSLSSRKTPLRRSRKLDAFEAIRARRRSGASEANLLVAKSWADVVKIGIPKAQKKIDKPVLKALATKKKPKPKTPARKIKDLLSTGHADSPATILVGRAHTRKLNLTGYVPKVVRNQAVAVKVNPAHNESFTGMAELFSTPVNASKRRSSRSDASKVGTPKSTVEMSVMQTPEEAGEMVVSPLDSPATTQRKRYGRDAVSRLLEVSLSPDRNSAVSENTEEATSVTSKANRKSVGLTGVKRIMKTPKQKGKPITDPHALRKLLKTPKDTASTQAYIRRSANLEVLGVAQLMKTPKQKGEPVEDLAGVKRIMKTPKQKGEPVEDMLGIKRIMRTPRQKGEPVEDYTGVKRIMRTPKEKGQPVEDMVGVKRIMRTPKHRGQPVEDMVGIKRLMRTPKERVQPVEDINISHLMSTPVNSTQSAENTRPIEEIFGMRNLVKTPPKKLASEQALTTDTTKAGDALGPLGTISNTPGRRGRLSKRLSLTAETVTTVNEVQKTLAVAESEIAQESGVQISKVIESAQKKKGRLSKNISAVPSSEIPKESTAVPEVTSPSRRGRPRSIISPVADNVTALPDEESVSQARTESVSDEVISPSRRGRPRSTSSTPKKPVAEVTSPTQKGRISSAVAKESLSAAASPTRGGRPSTTLPLAEESLTVSQEVTSPSRRGRPSKTKTTSESVPTVELTSPSRRGRPSKTPQVKDSVQATSEKIISPVRRGRQSTTAEAAKESEETTDVVASPSGRGKQKTTHEELKESVAVSDAHVISPSRRGRTVEEAKESVPVANEVTSPMQRGRRQVLDPAAEGNPKKTRGRPQRTEVSKESVPVAAVTLQSRRGRSKDPVEVPKDSAPIAGAAAASKSTTEVPNEHPAIEDSSQTHKEASKRISDGSKELVPEVKSPRRGRPKASAELPNEPVVVTEEVSLTRSERSKISSEVPEKSTNATRRGRTKAKPDQSEEPILAASGDLTSARKGRSKAAAVVNEPVPEASSDVTSPARRGRPKVAEPKQPIPATNEVTSPPTRKGRPKTVDVPKEPVATADSNVTSPTSKGRSRTVEVAIPAASDVSLPTRRGRPKTTDVPEKPVPDSETTSPARRGRRQNTAAPQEPAPVSVEIASPKPSEKHETPDKANKVIVIKRGRGRKAVQYEQPTTTEEPQTSLEDSQKAELSVNSSPASKPIARRGGRRRNEEQVEDVPDPKPQEPKLDARRRGQSKSRNADEASKDTVDVPDKAESPATKTAKRSAKLQKDVQSEPPVEAVAKPVRGRQSKTAQKEAAAEISTSEATETTNVPQKKAPARGRSRARDTSDVSLEEQEQQEPVSAPVSKQRGRRKNQEAANETQVQAEPTAVETSRATRGKRGLLDNEQPASEVKGKKTAQGKDSAEPSVSEEKPSKGKSVQWHPLLTTDGSDASTDKVEETTIDAPTRGGGRSKGRTKLDTEPVPAKRSHRGEPEDNSEPPAVSEVTTATSVEATKGRRGRKAAIPQEPSEKDNSSGVQSSVETEQPLSKAALPPARGRKAAASNKSVVSESNEVEAVEVSTKRGKRGAAASNSPVKSKTSQSPAKPTSQSGAKVSSEVETKPARGVKRRNATTEASSSDDTNHVEAESVPTVRGKRNAANTSKPSKESLVEKQVASSPAKRRKTEAATSATPARGKSKEASKPENAKPVATRGRTNTRSKK